MPRPHSVPRPRHHQNRPAQTRPDSSSAHSPAPAAAARIVEADPGWMPARISMTSDMCAHYSAFFNSLFSYLVQRTSAASAAGLLQPRAGATSPRSARSTAECIRCGGSIEWAWKRDPSPVAGWYRPAQAMTSSGVPTCVSKAAMMSANVSPGTRDRLATNDRHAAAIPYPPDEALHYAVRDEQRATP